MAAILGKKLGMSQIFTEDGDRIPVTVIQAGPCTVTQVKTRERDGYEALQIGYGEIKERRLNKPRAGHFKKAGVAPQRHLAEIRCDLKEATAWVVVGEAAEKPAKKTRAKVKKAAGEAEKEVKENAEAGTGAEAGAEKAAAESEGGEAEEGAEATAEETEAGEAPAAEVQAEAAPEPLVQRDIPSAGDRITVGAFAVGEKVKVSGVSKGKGFAGVIKRHGFAGGPASHGAHFHRAPGSVGASAYPSHVFKGLRLPGHMGNRRATQPGLVVVATEPEQDLLMVKGAVPGSSNAIIFIQTQ